MRKRAFGITYPYVFFFLSSCFKLEILLHGMGFGRQLGLVLASWDDCGSKVDLIDNFSSKKKNSNEMKNKMLDRTIMKAHCMCMWL